jgi:uncharacterized repeat protein (TIGR03803 family)
MLAVIAPNGAKAAKMQILYSFPPGSAGYPTAGLAMDSTGNFYATTSGDGSGGGTVVKLAPRQGGGWKGTTLYSFCAQENCADGDQPMAGVILDSSGNMYGTTLSGGAYGFGAVFKIRPKGAEKVLYSFCRDQENCTDGRAPRSGLIADAQGNLYGTTVAGGANNSEGTVFKVTPDGKETVLYSFGAGKNDGSNSYAGLIADSQGNFYGTTQHGGKHSYGTVFKLAPDGTETVLYNFCVKTACADGAWPLASLVLDAKGNLYGTTDEGGTSGGCTNIGCGTVFKLTPKGKETVLYSFCSVGGENCDDGLYPQAGLVLDLNGNMYGTTNGNVSTAFRLTPKGKMSVLSYLDFSYSWFVIDNGKLYGTEYQGGDNDAGAIIELGE